MCTRVYVGNLPMDVRTRELDDLFYKYGRILDIDIKQPSRPPAFAFIEFDHPRDAEDAIRGRDGYEFDGQRLRVERTNGGGRRSDRGDSKGFGRNLMGSGKQKGWRIHRIFQQGRHAPRSFKTGRHRIQDTHRYNCHPRQGSELPSQEERRFTQPKP
ncbi:hypothetical protein DYB32_008127 [Aphanomyces invadans]|uniref:RRM domain-containing protein n=1 Tax=Aphanomyces invadans TaxID=157072 RepID=A0A418AM63_9STRA|nr:hypothetical protein DYB32_008127 [Aphanomyces invadans]